MSILNFKEWLIAEEFSTAESLVEAFYSRAGGSNVAAPAKKTREEEIALAKSSNLKTMNVGKWLVKPTLHGAAQAADRVGNITKQQWADMHQRMVDTLAKVTDIPTKKETEIIFYSKSLKQGYVVAHDPQHGELRIMTVLPSGNQIAKPGTKKIMMESPVDVFYLELNEEDGSHIWESCVMTEEQVLSYAALRGDALGFIIDPSDITRVVDAQPDNPEGIAQYVRINVPFKQSPSGTEYTGSVDFEVYRPGSI